MLHHATFTEDPDVRTAIEAFRPTVLQIRAHSAKLAGLREGSVERRAEQGLVDDLVADMQTRVDRIGLTLDELFRLINEDLRLIPLSVDHRPIGAHLRTLEAEAIRAASAERRAHEALTGAQERVARATAARISA